MWLDDGAQGTEAADVCFCESSKSLLAWQVWHESLWLWELSFWVMWHAKCGGEHAGQPLGEMGLILSGASCWARYNLWMSTNKIGTEFKVKLYVYETRIKKYNKILNVLKDKYIHKRDLFSWVKASSFFFCLHKNTLWLKFHKKQIISLYKSPFKKWLLNSF